MKKIILEITVSDEMFEATTDMVKKSQVSSNGSAVCKVDTTDSTVPDKHRLFVLDMVALSFLQRNETIG